MDIKFGLVLILLACISSTAVARRKKSRHHREIRRTVREYLAPPAPDASYSSYGSPANLVSYRPEFLSSPRTTEAPGYFSRIASWLNPFGGSPTPPPFADLPHNSYGTTIPPHRGYPSSFPYPPPAGPQGYLPPKGKGRPCNPCDNVPWVPLRVIPGQAKDTYASSSVKVNEGVQSGQGGLSEYNGSPSLEVKTPDFHYDQSAYQKGPQQPSLRNTLPGTIPLPHLYTGPMPPLFKAKPFRQQEEDYRITPPVLPPLLEYTGGPVTTISGPQDGEYVDVLPPNAEVAPSGPNDNLPPSSIGEIVDSPPSDYNEHDSHPREPIQQFIDHPDPVYGSSNADVQQSQTVYEEHSPSSSSSGHKTEEENVQIVKSIAAAEYSQTIEHPIQFEQSPIIDVSPQGQSQGQSSEYPIGLNPPPDGPVDSYGVPVPDGQTSAGVDSPSPSSNVPKDSYGVPISKDLQKDSLFDSTANNVTVFLPTPSYADLGVSNGVGQQTVPDINSPSIENIMTSVDDGSLKNKAIDPSPNPLTAGPLTDAERLNKELLDHHGFDGNNGQTFQGSQELVDSYQHHIKENENLQNQQNSQKSLPNSQEMLVPYRPSSVYVPYPPYSSESLKNRGQGFAQPPPTTPSGPTTDEPFLDALMKSYNNFKQEEMFRENQERIRAENQRHTMQEGMWYSQPQPTFSSPEQVNPSLYTSNKMMPPPPPAQPQESKRNKQVQIIIPYTAQYTPSPFQPSEDDWSGRGSWEQTQGRKVPIVETSNHNNLVTQESRIVEVTRSPKPLAHLLMMEAAKSPVNKANNSIDGKRLQKNIDNWTIQEYSRGMTSSTALPSSSHPYLLPSKKIPQEYLTSTQPPVSKATIDVETANLSGFHDNDLEQEGSASSRVDVPHIQGLEGTTKPNTTTDSDQRTSKVPVAFEPTTTTSTTTTEASWDTLDVSISPHNNERVYVVTPLPASRSSKVIQMVDDAEPLVWKMDHLRKSIPIERAYQVLPQAVNNLAAVASTGSESIPLWGIMEHEEYAKSNGSTSSVPVLYSGHSKVSNTRQWRT